MQRHVGMLAVRSGIARFAPRIINRPCLWNTFSRPTTRQWRHELPRLPASHTFCSNSHVDENSEDDVVRDRDYFMKVLKHTATHRLHDEALQAFKTMRKQNIEPTILIYNMLLISCQESSETVLQLIEEINESPVRPDLATVVAISNHYAGAQQYRDANDYNNFMLDILKREYRADPLKNALIAYRQLKEVKMKSNALLYSVIIHHYLAEDQLRMAYNMLMEMIDLKIKFSITTADTVMDQCIQKGFKKQANNIFKHLNADHMLTGYTGVAMQDSDPIQTMKDFESIIDSDDFYGIRSSVKAQEYHGHEGESSDSEILFDADSSIFGKADPEDLFGTASGFDEDVDEGDFQFDELRRKE